MIVLQIERFLAVARGALATLLIGVALVWVSAPAFAQVADWDKVITAAKAEGGLVLYTGLVGAPSTKAIAKAFEAKYGIPVQVLEARASELRERIRTEQSAGRYLGDVMFNSENQAIILNAEDKSIAPHEPVPNATGLTEPFRDDGIKAPVMTINYGLLINTRLVPPGEEPKSWRDLTDPKWKGKILSDDMRPLGSGNTLFAVLQNHMGPGFNEKLAEQKPVFSRDMRNDARRVARGEYPIYISQVFAFASDLKGLPVKVIVPKEGAPYAEMDFALLKNAPHSNAARLFMQHFLGLDSQSLYADAWMLPVVRGAADHASPDAQPYANAKLMGAAKLSERPDMMALAKKLYP